MMVSQLVWVREEMTSPVRTSAHLGPLGEGLMALRETGGWLGKGQREWKSGHH